MKKYLALLFLLPIVCFGQGAHRISQVIVKGNGIAANVSPGSKILVCTLNTGCATLANIYLDASLTTPALNPVTADGSGNYDYYVAGGCVDEQISSPGQSSIFVSHVCPFSGAGGGGSGCTIGAAGQMAYFPTTDNCAGDALFLEKGSGPSGGLAYTGNGAVFATTNGGLYTFDTATPSGGLTASSSFSVSTGDTFNNSATGAISLGTATNGDTSGEITLQANSSTGVSSGNINISTNGSGTGSNNIFLSTSGLHGDNSAGSIQLTSSGLSAYTAGTDLDLSAGGHIGIGSEDITFPGSGSTPLCVDPSGNMGTFGCGGGGGGTPGGSNGNLQYNNSGSFGGDAATNDDGAGNLSAKSYTATGTTNGFLGLTATGTPPGAAAANTIQVESPNAVTAYRVELPGAAPTAGNTYLSCTAASPSVCTWTSTASGALFPSTDGLVVNTSTTASRTGVASDVMTTLGNPPGDLIVGDSISAGTGASNVNFGYVNLIRPKIGGQQVIYARPGDMCLDSSVYITGNAGFLANGNAPLLVQECGTNDVTIPTNATVFKRIVTGNLLMAGVPQPNQIWAQSCTKTTGFATAENNFRRGMGESTTASGDVLTCVVNTGPLGDVAVYYLITNGGTGTFTINIAGTNQTDAIGSLGTSFEAFGDGGVTITTSNGTTGGFVGQVFTGFSPNTAVNVVFTTTAASTTAAPVEIGWVGGMPATSTLNPNVAVISPNHQNNANDTLSGTYAGYEQAIATQLVSQGLNVTYLNTRDGMVADPLCGNGNEATMFSVCYADAIHPNGPTATTGGHASMGRIIVAGLPSGLITNAPTQLQNGPSSYYPSPLNPTLNPSSWWSPNPLNIDPGTAGFSPGIMLNHFVGNLNFLTYSSTWGSILVGPNAGGNNAAALCSVPGFWGTTPAALICPITATGNGIGRVGPSSSGLGGFQAAGGATAVGGAPNVLSTTITSSFGNQFESATNDIVPTGLATSGANFPSAPFYFDAGVWGGSARGLCGGGWQMIPATGTLPLTSLTYVLNPNITQSCLLNVDLSNTTAPNVLKAINFTTESTAANCSSAASPAVCGSASAGSVVIAAAATTVVVNSTAVTANSQIFVIPDESLGTKLGVTCNNTAAVALAAYGVTARTAGTSFTLTTTGTVATNPACYSYLIVN